jgi:hypothetical protein
MVFGDAAGLKDFFLVHRFVHDQTAAALAKQVNRSVSTFGLSSSAAEEAWAMLMREGSGSIPLALTDWLKFHADIHTTTYTLLGQPGTVAPDLSVADFSQAQGFNDWMFVHQQMHDFESSQLGLT